LIIDDMFSSILSFSSIMYGLVDCYVPRSIGYVPHPIMYGIER